MSVEASGRLAPDPNALGYDAAWNAGCVAADAGATVLAAQYFERALELRPTQSVLVRLAAVRRDLGASPEAERLYRLALTTPGKSTAFAQVGLAAVLADRREYEEAFQLCDAALASEPDNPAALMTAARCLDEVVETLGQGNVADEHIAAVRAQARGFRARAAALEQSGPDERLRARRDRAFPLHLIVPHESSEDVSVVQSPGEVAFAEPHVAPGSVPETDGSEIAPSDGLFARVLRWLRR